MLNDPNRVKEIFLEAAEQPDQAARAAYLDRACGGDAELRDRVEALLRTHDTAGSFLGSPAVKLPEPHEMATQDMGSAATPEEANEAEDLKFLDKPRRPDSLGRLGHYEMLQVLGRGGFGIVFRAFDDMLQRVVAVKVMAPQLAATSPARRRFLREARSSAAVRHENVVQVYEVGEQPLPYLAMEFIPGETLQQKLDRCGPLEVSEILRIGRQVAEGLAAAHACDLIHRDIKPGNILLEGGSHKAKITDFGLARAADDASISQSGIIAGTPMFMAPEQALGHKVDQRADLFSLGSVLYQMASGRPPFRAPSALAVLKRVAEEPPRPIPEIIPETPDWLCGIIAKLHAKNPADRFQSAREVADLLADCEAKLKAKQAVKNVLPAAVKPARRKWVASAAVLLLPVLALAVTEFAGVTHLFRGQQATADPDRKAAEYVLLIGGEVQVNDQDRTITSADELPRQPFRLMWVGLKHNRNLSDAGLTHFKDCKNLTFLGLFGSNVSDAGLANFQDCKKLIFLNLSQTRIGDAGLANFADCRDLTTVVLNGTNVSDAGLAYFKNCRNLTQIFLEKTKVTTAGIVDLKKRFPFSRIEWDGRAKQPVHVATQQLLPPTYKNSIGMEFVIVPKGKSWLGGGKDKPGDTEVDIPADFYLGKYEVTQEEWEKVMGENPSHFSRTGGGSDAVKDISDADLKRFPVENVSWDQCQLFVARLNKLEKESGWVYRLPKVTEWEYACRGGPMADKADSAFDYYFGKPTNTLLPEQANHKHNKGLDRSCRVGFYEGNRLGLFDMHGNVQEWCDDGDGVVSNFLRGGSFKAGLSRAAGFFGLVRSGRFPDLGLRLARVPSGAPSAEVKTPPATVAPFTDADVQRIAALPAAEQVEEVRKELMKRNPEFDGQVEHKSKDGVVTEVRIDTEKVSDISPIRVWNGLRALDCGTPQRKRSPLADLTPLKGMNLAGLAGLHLSRTRVDDAGLSYFKDCKNLTHLELNATKATDAGLANFKDCKNLRHLVLNGTQVTDVGMARFSDCKNLTTLSVSWTKLTDAGLTNFKECKNLAYLELGGTQTTDAGVAHFKDCKNLSSLYLFNTEVTDAGLTHLKDCKNLTTLSLSSCPQVSDAGLAHLAGLDSLTELTLTKTKVSAKGVEDLAKALPKCKITWDGGTIEPRITIAPFTDADIKRIAALPAEQQVEQVRRELMRRNPGFDGKMETKIEGDAVTEFGIVTDKVTDIAPIRVFDALRVLKCRGTWPNDGLLADLTPLKGMNLAGLTYLDLQNTRVTDAGMVYFKDCKNLTSLYLNCTRVSDAGLSHFKDCKDLKYLILSATNVSDVGLVHFKDCKNLKHLDLGGTEVGDAGLAHFKDCKNLDSLQIDGSQVSVAGLARFKGMPLMRLVIYNTGITDLTPLQGMPLKEIRLTPKNITRGLDILRDMKSLKTIGIAWHQAWPAAEFWERYDKGEFTK